MIDRALVEGEPEYSNGAVVGATRDRDTADEEGVR
jgi:hypothetical protein